MLQEQKIAPYIKPVIGSILGASAGGLGGYLGGSQLGVQNPNHATLYCALGGGALGAASGYYTPQLYDRLSELLTNLETDTDDKKE